MPDLYDQWRHAELHGTPPDPEPRPHTALHGLRLALPTAATAWAAVAALLWWWRR